MNPESAETKWLIDEAAAMSAAERHRHWREVYAGERRDQVFSMTEDPGVQDRILDALATRGSLRVLVPGCGAATHLPQALAERLPADSEIVCTDFVAEAIEQAEATFSHPRVSYRRHNTIDVAALGNFDAVVIVNSILSDSDRENRAMLRACADTLRQGGRLVGFFPTIYCALEIATLERHPGKLANIDLPTSTCFEEEQGVRQVFYTPLHLRRVMREAGLAVHRMELFFCDSDHFAGQGRRLYQIFDEDLVPYEFFVVADRVV
ncbi:class I SAM-dependent methyltransferase [Nocardia sp. NPDC060256]|uniref:class I SAM-dependent methyltransferase n=1 Tax=unclassified Nocardia TaxID=2637762 RepID=UPI003665F5AB